MALVPNSTPYVCPIRFADRGLSYRGKAYNFLGKRDAPREEAFVALDEWYLVRRERVDSLETDVESLAKENHCLKDNVVELEAKLSSRIFEVSSFRNNVPTLEIQSTVVSAELLSSNQEHDQYFDCLFSDSLIGHFESKFCSRGH